VHVVGSTVDLILFLFFLCFEELDALLTVVLNFPDELDLVFL